MRKTKCKRCGECCKAVICAPGEAFFGHDKGPCPALMFNSKTKEYACGALLRSKLFCGEIYAALVMRLEIGTRCTDSTKEKHGKHISKKRARAALPDGVSPVWQTEAAAQHVSDSDAR